ncbi:terpenoid synthase [Trametes punicea]|nr:terpenoid synthase [Trametes punicea]
MPQFYRLPDTMANWPWPRRVNPFYEEVSAESSKWLRSFKAFDEKGQIMLDKCNFGLLASLSYPNVDRDHLRVACDLMMLFFVIDEYTDAADTAGAQEIANLTIDGIVHPWRQAAPGEHVVGEITRQRRALKYATPTAQARFLEAWSSYALAVVEQTKDRQEDRARNMEEYLAVRRYTIGARPCFALAELRLDLPSELINHPLVEELAGCVIDLIILDNNLASYTLEYVTADMHNIIAVAMHEKELDLDGGAECLAREHAKRVDRFLSIWPEVSTLDFGSGAVNEDFRTYLDHLANWPRANDCWNFESGRYFGENGWRAKKERVVGLAPLKECVQLSQL